MIEKPHRKKSLAIQVLEAMRSEMVEQGFRSVLRDQGFYRRQSFGLDYFGATIANYRPEWILRPMAWVRFDEVEQIRARFGPYGAKHFTVGTMLGSLDRKKCEVAISSESRIRTGATKMIRIFREKAIPVFERFRSIEAVDEELNRDWDKESPYGGLPSKRCVTGIIVASLLSRPNRGELAGKYRAKVQSFASGFYLKEYDSVLRYLGLHRAQRHAIVTR